MKLPERVGGSRLTEAEYAAIDSRFVKNLKNTMEKVRATQAYTLWRFADYMPR